MGNVFAFDLQIFGWKRLKNLLKTKRAPSEAAPRANRLETLSIFERERREESREIHRNSTLEENQLELELDFS